MVLSSIIKKSTEKLKDLKYLLLLKVKDTEPSEETLFKCCKLAREYSSATQPSKVGVIYTKRKFIKKPPKAPLGYVIYKNEKEILV